MKSFICYCSLILAMGFGACTNGETDTSEKTAVKTYETKDLYGHWNVVAAKRNGQTTESLYGAYFEFQDDGTMLTNISGEDDETPFEYKEGSLIQNGPQPLNYAVDFQSDSTLMLVLEIQGTKFEMSLLRGE
ncbi:MAG: hypothetical protein AAFP19_13765 [Bacteroidota bacterium]